jgi:hypothetical protein
VSGEMAAGGRLYSLRGVGGSARGLRQYLRLLLTGMRHMAGEGTGLAGGPRAQRDRERAGQRALGSSGLQQ